MKLLLDTHVVLWWQRDDRRLNKAARHAIAKADLVWVSAISGWEVAIKSALGRLRIDEPFRVLIVGGRLHRAADDAGARRRTRALCHLITPIRSIAR